MRVHKLFRRLIFVAGLGALTTTYGFAAPAPKAMPVWSGALASADLKDGRREAYKCQSCHDLTASKMNMIGPPLWGVVDRPRAKAPGFRYSAAMKARTDPWTYDRLFTYLKNPQADVPGTTMSFPGIANAKARVNLIAWLRTQSENPVPIPAAPATKRASRRGP
jgi:cytochrome c